MSAINSITSQDVSQDPGTHPIGYMDQIIITCLVIKPLLMLRLIDLLDLAKLNQICGQIII